jgi:hypothetical protein
LFIEKKNMRRSFLYFTILILTLAIISCTKTKAKPNNGATTADTASIIGTWNWAYQSGTRWDIAPGDTTSEGQPISTIYTPANTGISRTLIFDSTGKITFIHNDSVFQQDYLQVAEPVQLLPAMETDTGFYLVSVGIVGCSITDTSTLTIINTVYQLGLATDTLMVHLDPCLSRVVDVYVRKN